VLAADRSAKSLPPEELARAVQTAITAQCDLDSRPGLRVRVRKVDVVEPIGKPQTLRARVTLHLSAEGNPFCCMEPGCLLGLHAGRLVRTADHVRRLIGRRGKLVLELPEGVDVEKDPDVRLEMDAVADEEPLDLD